MSRLSEIDEQIVSAELRAERAKVRYYDARKELAVLQERRERMTDPSRGASPVAQETDPLTGAASLAIEDLDDPPGSTWTTDDLATKLGIGDARAEAILAHLARLGGVAAHTGRNDVRVWRVLNADETRVRDVLVRDGAIEDCEALGNRLGMFGEEVTAILRTFAERGLAVFDGHWRYVAPGPERAVTRRRTGATPEQEAAAGTQRNGAAVALTGKARGTTHSPQRDRELLQSGHRLRTPSNKGTRIKGRSGKGKKT